MADDLLATLFAEARARHETTCRWLSITAIALAVFHLMIFHPYADLARQKVGAEAAVLQQTALKGALDGMAPQLETLKTQITGEADVRLKELLTDLKGAFARLNAVLPALQNLGPDAAEGEPGERLFSQARLAQAAQIQVQGPQGPAAADLPIMSGPLRRSLAQSTSRDTNLNLIKSYVDQQIVDPRFTKFNARWQNEVVPPIVQEGQKLADATRTAQDKFPEAAASWASATLAISQIVDAASQFKIQAPQGLWWATVETKEATVRDALLALTNVEQNSDPALKNLLQRTEAAIAENKEKQKAIAAKTEALNEQFLEQQKQLASMVEPLKAISVNLANVALFFPLILSATFVILTGLLTARIRQLGQIVTLLSRKETSSLAPEWLLVYLDSSPWHKTAAVFARCAAIVAWIALASYELDSFFPGGRAQTILFAAIGGTAISLLSFYEWRTAEALKDSLHRSVITFRATARG